MKSWIASALLLTMACAHAPPPERLSREHILEVLEDNVEDVRRCQAVQREAADEVQGVMRVFLRVQPDGTTSQLRVEEGYEGTPAARCMLESVAGWRFPRFTGPPQPLDFPVRVGPG